MDEDATMSSEKVVQQSELADDVYSPNSNLYSKQKEAEQRVNMEGTQPEQPEKPKEIQGSCDVVDQPRTSQQLHPESTNVDLPSLQEYISRVPEALVPEFALLLAQRMKQHVQHSHLRD
jgi:hypothetical protein